MVKLAFGSFGDSLSNSSLKSYLTEFIATLLFVFSSIGLAISYGKFTRNATLDIVGLVVTAIAHALALLIGAFLAVNISHGHVNPIITFGLTIGGNITIITGVFYWIAQCVGSIVACYLLQFVTSGLVVPTHGVVDGMNGVQGEVMQTIISFVLVYMVYATIDDPKKVSFGTVTPIITGFIVGVNLLAANEITQSFIRNKPVSLA